MQIGLHPLKKASNAGGKTIRVSWWPNGRAAVWRWGEAPRRPRPPQAASALGTAARGVPAVQAGRPPGQ